MNTKICPLCKRTLPVSMFGVNNTSKDGLQSWCNDCSHKYQTLRIKYKSQGGVKVCKRCRRMLPKSDFYKSNGHTRDGYQSYCKECCKETTYISRGNNKEIKITSISDAELIQILKTRGFTGTLTKKMNYDI